MSDQLLSNRHITGPRGLSEKGLRTVRRYATAWLDHRWEVNQRGEWRIPDDGPVILAANHIGWLDGPVLFLKAPRPAHALVKRELFVGRTGKLLTYASQIPVDRRGTDAGALRTAADALAAGQVIVTFPEGRRGDGELQSIKNGVGWLALVSGAPVVPVAIFGTREPGAASESRPPKGARIDVVYGEPIRFPETSWPRSKAMIDDVSEQILEHLRNHLTWAKGATKRGLPGPLPAGSTSD
ncbi:MAG: lysophospholipid acyltransferase family protein [Aeromicrobium sp.]